MRTTGKGVYKWINSQENIKWPRYGGRLLVYFDYKGVRCAGIISKTLSNGKLIKAELSIRPMQSIKDIGNGAGEAVYITFEKDANKPPQNLSK